MSTADNFKEDYDLIAIGGGPAGESATELAAFFGYSCLIIEKDKPGGTVTTTGGVPTKTLREAALYFTGFRDRDIYGMGIESPPEIMLDAIRARTWSVSENLQNFTRDNITKRGVDYLQGRARLQPGKRVVVESAEGERTLRGKVILLATGSRPTQLNCGLPLNHPGLCDTDTILKRGHPPKALLIVGSGAVAIEFATIARALGIPVTIVSQSDRPLTMMDGEISTRLSNLMAEWGVRFIPSATIKNATANGDWLDVALTNGTSVTVDTILLAAGRVSNTEGLGLESVGVPLSQKGRIAVDKQYFTGIPGIYAAGDVIGPTLASIAMEQGRAAVCHALGIPVEGIVDPAPASAVYGMPEVARVGLTEEDCLTQGLDYEVGRSELSQTPRGAIAGRSGLLKLIFLKDSRKLVGVHCIGDIASELVGIGHMAIRCGGTLNTIANMTFNTPTYSYAYKYAAFDGLRRSAAHNRPAASSAVGKPREPLIHNEQGREL